MRDFVTSKDHALVGDEAATDHVSEGVVLLVESKNRGGGNALRELAWRSGVQARSEVVSQAFDKLHRPTC